MARQDRATLMHATYFDVQPSGNALPQTVNPRYLKQIQAAGDFDSDTDEDSDHGGDDNNNSDSETETDVKMVVIERRIKVVTEQHNIDKPAQMEGFPMKEWTIEIYLLDQEGKEHPANCFTKVTYNLHPSFEQPTQTYTEPPFKCTNEGWGEFEMTIDMYTTEKGGKTTIQHDLNFAKPTYENIHKVTFRNPSMALQAILRETGPIPTDEERKKTKTDGGLKNKKKVYDVEKMADALPHCDEDDLLQVIQMIHDGKTEGSFVSNNIDGKDAFSGNPSYRIPTLQEEMAGGDIVAGEFSVDLYTLPDDTLVQLWEFLTRLGLVN